VDGVGFLEKIERKGESVRLQIKAPREILRYLVPKGSVAIDGISFTLQKVGKSFFTVGVTPHTFRVTTLRGKRVGERVNLEVDLFAKLVRHFLSDRRRGTLKAGLNVGKEIL
jgi:riboflavin synthase